MKRSIIITGILLLTTYLTFSQGKERLLNRRKVIRRNVRNIKKDNTVYGESIGRFPFTPKHYRRYDTLKTLCTESELVQLTKHKSPVVRCYAFLALTETNSNQTLQILKAHKNDTARLEQHYGCISSYTWVINSMYDSYSSSQLANNVAYNANYLTLITELKESTMERFINEVMKKRSRDERLKFIKEELKHKHLGGRII